MVQFFRGSPDPRDAAYGKLAESLGQGLGNAVQDYRAGKALDSVLDDESNSELPLSEKMGKLERALRPYGERGKNMLMQRLMVEQQADKEKQQKIKTKEELESEKRLFSHQKELQLLKNSGKSAPGGLGGQPIPQDQIQKIFNTLNANKEATADELGVAMGKAGVDPYYSKPYIDSRTKRDETIAANAPGKEYAKGREKAIETYVTDALKSADEADSMDSTIDTVERAIQGDITEPGIMATLKHDPYGQLFFGLTPDEATLTAANKYMLEGTKGIFGSKPTEREIFTLLNSMLPSIGKTKEANLAGLQVIKRANALKKQRAEIVSELTDGGKNYVADIESKVNKSMQPFVDKFRKDAYELKKVLDDSEKTQQSKAKEGKIKVKAPSGQTGFMTQQQIDEAKAKNVIFTPV